MRHFLLAAFWLGTLALGTLSAAETNAPLPGFQLSTYFHEQILTYSNSNGVRIQINAPAPEAFASNKTVKLIFYALPNGNSIEQTVGKQLQPGDDWHFNIQHIGAQTRFLREKLTNQTIVIAYLEGTTAIGKAWPAWRKKNGDAGIPEILASVRQRFESYKLSVVLTGHSGGGSLTFGYLNTQSKIPDDIERIAFLDSNYAYDTTNHLAKLTTWLKASDHHFLTILAYHDNIALLDGKTFVSAEGGTWGRSHLMKKDLATVFPFTEKITPDWEHYTALEGRVKFFLRENPDKKILHTIQVEKNGFIHAMLAGTPDENQGYEYFGEQAYGKFIEKN